MKMLNNFEKALETRKLADQQAKTPVTVESVEARKQSQREAWTSGNRGNGSGHSVVLDPKTIQLRDAAIKAKAAPKVETPAPQVSHLTPEEEGTLAHAWVQRHPEFPITPYNGEIMEKIVKALRLPVSFAGFDQAFKYGTEHNHFEPVRRQRGQAAPVPFTSAMKVGQ